MSKSGRARRARTDLVETLPLFSPAGLPPERSAISITAGEAGAAARDLALDVYWSSGLHAHALAAAASQTKYPRERWALRRLAERAEEQRELAAELLRLVWQIDLPPTHRHSSAA